MAFGNDYNRACSVEARAMNEILPFIRDSSFQGRFVLTNKGALHEFLQTSCGDAIANDGNGNVVAFELKAEEENKHGNFFLETWSNRTFQRQTPGWLVTLRADVLLYYFLKEKELYCIPKRDLWEWAWEKNNGNNLMRFGEKPQKKYDQPNLTYGRCVPIHVIRDEVGFQKYTVRHGQFVEVLSTDEQAPGDRESIGQYPSVVAEAVPESEQYI